MKLKSIAMEYNVPAYFAGAMSLSTLDDQAFIAPHVPVSAAQYNYWEVDSATQLRDVDTRISPLGDAPTIQFPGVKKSGLLQDHGLDVPFPVSALDAKAQVVMDLKNQGMAALNLVRQSRLRDTLRILAAAGGAGTDLSAASAADQVAALQAGINDVLLGCGGWAGGMEIRMAWGPAAATAFGAHSSVKGYTTGGATKDKGGMVNITNFPSLFQEQTVHRKIMAARVTSNVGAAAEARSFTLGASVYIFACLPTATEGDPSAIKTFAKNADAILDYYTKDNGRVEVAKVDGSYDIKLTNTLAVKRFNFVA